MIGRKAHPQHPDDHTRCVFVPLTHNRHTGECVPIMGLHGSHEDELAAARVCLADWLEHYWSDIHRLARHVRAFCEHPEFASFTGDGIDAEMIKTSAQQLAEVVELGSHTISRLFDPPTEDDDIRFGDLMYELDPETRHLIPAQPIASDVETRSADTLLARYIRMAVRKVSELLQRPISRRGIEQAIDHLILTLPPDDDEDESTERLPSQFVTDHRAVRYLLTSIEKAEKRTGRQVSTRAMQAMIAMLERLIANHDNEIDNAITEKYPLPGAVLRAIEDEAPADDLDSNNGRGNGRGTNGPDGGGDGGNDGTT